MIRREGARMALSGPVTLANVEEVLEEGRRQLQDGVERIDLSGVTEMDSALLALLLAWLREAKGRSLVLENPPAALRTCKRLLREALRLPAMAAFDREVGELNRMIRGNPEATEAMTAFMQKRKPDFSKFK